MIGMMLDSGQLVEGLYASAMGLDAMAPARR